MATKRVSREELYEQVWQTPMSRLAAQYGVSDVALAKTCRRMNVPRPGRGYWARLAAGEKLKRPPLPQPRQGDELWTHVRESTATFTHPAVPKPPRVPPPKVAVSGSLRAAHGAIAELGEALQEAKKDEYDRLVVPGSVAPTFVVSIEAHRRALLLLDGLARGLHTRGHNVVLRRDGERLNLEATVNDIAIAISVNEHLERTDHVPNADEQDRIKRGVSFGIPKYDYETGGRLQMMLHGTSARAAWSDTETKRLEGALGTVIVVAEAEAEHRRLRRLAEEEQRRREEQLRLEREAEERRQQILAEQRRREQEEEKRRQKAAEDRLKHEAALVRDFEAMIGKWRLAHDARAFLAAFKERVPEAERDAPVAHWLSWAEAVVDRWDPLTHSAGVVQGFPLECSEPSER